MEEKQSLYLVFGGKVKKIGIDCFKNPNELEVVGIFDNLKKAKEAWKAKSIRYIDDANKIKNTEIAKHLALPPVKIHCSVLAEDAIKAAISDYKKKNST